MKTNTLIVAVAAASIIVMVYFTTQTMRNTRGDNTPGETTGVSSGRDERPASPLQVPQSAFTREDTADTAANTTSEPAPHTATDSMQGKAQVEILLPPPVYRGTPKEIKGAQNLEPPRDGKPYPVIIVPIGCDKLLSHRCRVTSSDPDPIIGELSFITDGDKEFDSATYAELAPGTQWVQIDLGSEKEIHAVCIWHHFEEMVQLPLRGGRVYRDVICQISNDPDFIEDIVTVFNNDHDNSSKQGIGKDKEYIETNEGRPFAVNAVKGRYVRCYSRGNTSNEMNHYIEVEVYGKGD